MKKDQTEILIQKTKNIVESCDSIKDVFNIDENIGDFYNC